MLAACLLPLMAGAFVPGSVLRAPHARVRPALSSASSGHLRQPTGRAGARALPPQRQVHAPRMASWLPAAVSPEVLASLGPGVLPPRAEQQVRVGPAPAHVPVKATKIIGRWAEYAARLEAESTKDNDDKTQQRMRGTQSMLTRMRADIAAKKPTYVFALTDDGYDGYQALATVAIKDEWDTFGTEKRSVVSIMDIVSLPLAGQWPDAGADLYRRIADWAASSDRMVTLVPASGDDLASNYRSLGLEALDGSAVSLVNAEYSSGGASSPPKLRFITLRV